MGAILPIEARHRMDTDSLGFPFAKKIAASLSADSIHMILKSIPDSPEKLYAMAYLLQYKVNKFTKLPIPWADETLSLARKFDDDILLFNVYRSIGVYERGMDRMEKALLAFLKSSTYAKLANYPKGRIQNLPQLVAIYKLRNDYEKAFELAYENLAAHKTQNPSFELGYAHYQLGDLYVGIKDYQEANDQYDEAEAIFRAINNINFVNRMLRKKAIALREQQLLDSALVMIWQSIEVYKGTGKNMPEHLKGRSLKLFGDIYFDKGDFNQALEHYLRADPILKANYRILGTMRQIGKTQMAREDFEAAEQTFLKLLDILKNQAYNTDLPTINTLLAQLYLKKKDFIKARDYALIAKAQVTKQKLLFKNIAINELLAEALFATNQFDEAFAIQKENSKLSEEANEELKNQNARYLKLRYQLQAQRNKMETEHRLALKETAQTHLILFVLLALFSLIFFLLYQILRITKRTNKNLELKVSERTQTLQEKTHLLNNYINNLPGASFSLKFENDVVPVFISTGMEENLGFKKSKILENANATDLFVRHDYRDYVRTQIKSFFVDQDTENILELVFPINNTEKWVLQRSKLRFDPKEGYLMDGILIDITNRMMAEFALAKSEKQLSTIYNSSKDLIGLLNFSPDGNHEIESLNQTSIDFLRKFKWVESPEAIKGMKIRDFCKSLLSIPEDQIKERLNFLHDIIALKKPYSYEEPFMAPNSEKYILDVSVSPILNEEDICTKILFVIRDVTLKHRAKEKVISKILETEDRERSRFAKELHDGLGQHLTAAALNFNLVQKSIGVLPEDIQQRFISGNQFLKEAINESRNIAHHLMPQSISDFGYTLTVESLLENLNQSTATKFIFYHNLETQRLPADLELSLYRITQEAINNILKHAEASEATIQLIKHPKSVILTIEDNGRGFNATKNKSLNFGLSSIKNRAKAHSGILQIDSTPGRGTSITLEFSVNFSGQTKKLSSQTI